MWITMAQVHPDDVDTVKTFGANLERKQFTNIEKKIWGRFYALLYECAEDIRRKMAELEEEKTKDQKPEET